MNSSLFIHKTSLAKRTKRNNEVYIIKELMDISGREKLKYKRG